MAAKKIGRVAIVPKGDYLSTVRYDRLDLVAFQGATYLCLKPVSDIEPLPGVVSEYWQPFGTSVEIANLGTTGIVRPDGETIEVKDAVTGRLGVASELIEQINGNSDDIELINETLGTDEELDDLPYPAKSMAGNISQINSNLSDKISNSLSNYVVRDTEVTMPSAIGNAVLPLGVNPTPGKLFILSANVWSKTNNRWEALPLAYQATGAYGTTLGNSIRVFLTDNIAVNAYANQTCRVLFAYK